MSERLQDRADRINQAFGMLREASAAQADGDSDQRLGIHMDSQTHPHG